MPNSGYPSRPELEVERLGDGRFPSPLADRGQSFVTAEDGVLLPATVAEVRCWRERGWPAGELPAFEAAGARESLFFDPARTTCAIVSCGGLCPGINNVIRSLTLALTWGYGIKCIYGFRYGYAGVAGEASAGEPLLLTKEEVEPIHRWGGSVLGSSRGPQDPGRMVENLQQLGIEVLFAIGGDGTLRGVAALAAEIKRRGLAIAVVGVPKTIDNDIAFIDRSFGFATAVEAARLAIDGAHAEAAGALNGVGLVKLMGRHSGFIAAHASLATSDVNFCLVPEVPFAQGPFLAALEKRLRERRHAVVVVAEGAGQDLFPADGATGGAASGRDASGNKKLHDVGPLLKEAIDKHFKEAGMAATVKYFDPSYIVRSVPANAFDAEYCLMLGQHAAHAGMAGRTNMLVGWWRGHFTHLPVALAVAERKKLEPQGPVWQRVLEATGQPAEMT
jgi:6-phosphofructokinase 1